MGPAPVLKAPSLFGQLATLRRQTALTSCKAAPFSMAVTGIRQFRTRVVVFQGEVGFESSRLADVAAIQKKMASCELNQTAMAE